MNVDLQELRNWISLFLLVTGGAIALRTYLLNQRQRRLENSFRLLDLCKNSLTDGDILSWHMIHVASSEQAGAKPGFFVDKREQIPFAELFSPNIIARQSIERFCELFNLVCFEYLQGTLDIRLFYFEYGQYMSTTYYWVSSVHNSTDFVKTHYPFFHKTFKKHERHFSTLPHKTISHLE